jgi:hypothetical protein
VVLTHVLIHTIDAALEDRKIALDGIGMRVTSDVFVCRMDDSAMAGEFLADLPIDAAFIRAEVGIGGERFGDDRLILS